MKQAWQKKGGQGKGGAGKGGQAKGRPPGGRVRRQQVQRCEGRPAAAIARGDSEPAQAVPRPDFAGRTSADGPVPQGHGRSPQAARPAAADVMPPCPTRELHPNLREATLLAIPSHTASNAPEEIA